MGTKAIPIMPARVSTAVDRGGRGSRVKWPALALFRGKVFRVQAKRRLRYTPLPWHLKNRPTRGHRHLHTNAHMQSHDCIDTYITIHPEQ